MAGGYTGIRFPYSLLTASKQRHKVENSGINVGV